MDSINTNLSVQVILLNSVNNCRAKMTDPHWETLKKLRTALAISPEQQRILNENQGHLVDCQIPALSQAEANLIYASLISIEWIAPLFDAVEQARDLLKQWT